MNRWRPELEAAFRRVAVSCVVVMLLFVALFEAEGRPTLLPQFVVLHHTHARVSARR